jgi:Leucine-rich repeat (LRR) protein
MKNLQALFLSGNRIHTRDLNYFHRLGRSLRKLDLSENRIVFLPEAEDFRSMRKLEYLMLHGNEIVGWE